MFFADSQLHHSHSFGVHHLGSHSSQYPNSHQQLGVAYHHHKQIFDEQCHSGQQAAAYNGTQSSETQYNNYYETNNSDIRQNSATSGQNIGFNSVACTSNEHNLSPELVTTEASGSSERYRSSKRPLHEDTSEYPTKEANEYTKRRVACNEEIGYYSGVINGKIHQRPSCIKEISHSPDSGNSHTTESPNNELAVVPYQSTNQSHLR